MKAETGKVYRHYKGQKYFVINIVVHTETKEELVIYRKYSDNLWGKVDIQWARPRAMFEEEITVEGKKIHRFSKIEE